MKKHFLGFVLVCAITLIPSFAHAKIQNLDVKISDRYISFTWSPLDDATIKASEGYALQWGKSESEVAKDKTDNVRRWVEGIDPTVPSMLTSTVFDNNETYYARVYTWTKGGYKDRVRSLGNGSDILKFTLNRTGNEVINIERIPKTDLQTDNTSSSSSSNTNYDADEYQFGYIQSTRFDNYVVLSWSRSKLARGEALGRRIKLSKTADMKEVVANFTIPVATQSLKIQNLTPNTTYYLQGSYYTLSGGEEQDFGHSTAQTLQTLRAMTQAEKDRITMLQRRGVFTIPTADLTKTIGKNDSPQTTSTTTNTETTTETTPPPSQTNTTTSTNPTNAFTYSKNDIVEKIKALETELNLWKTRYRNLTGEFYGSTSNNTTNLTTSTNKNSTSSSTNTNRRMTLAERIRMLRSGK